MIRADLRRLFVKLLLLASFVVLTNFRFGPRVAELYERGAAVPLLAFFLIWTLACAGLLAAALLPRLWMRLLWALPIALATIFGNAIYHASGELLTFYDVLLYWSERAHAGSAIETYASFGILPLGLSALGVAALAIPPPRLSWSSGWLALGPLLPIALIMTLVQLEGGRGTRSLPEQFNLIAMMAMLAFQDLDGEIQGERLGVTLEPVRAPEARHIVLIVDESVRGDFIDLNTPRGTTPYLASQSSRMSNFGLAISGNNCSIFSNLILRFGGTRENLSHSVRTGASLWRYARRAGFRSVYLDGQQSGGRLQNAMTLLERSRIDEFIQLDASVAQPDRDLQLAERLRELLDRPESQLIYVIKAGVHFPYERRYRRSADDFSPHMDVGEALGGGRERLVNSYRNAIRWSVDGFFERLLAGLDLAGRVLIYTSDHGQNLLEGRGLLQCNASDPQPFEGIVPLVVMTGSPELALRFQQASTLNSDRASHFEIFPTLLALLGFEKIAVEARYGPSLFDPLPGQPRSFSFGPIAMLGGREVRWRQVPPGLGREP